MYRFLAHEIPREQGSHPHCRVCVILHRIHHEANDTSLSGGSSISTGPGVAHRIPTNHKQLPFNQYSVLKINYNHSVFPHFQQLELSIPLAIRHDLQILILIGISVSNRLISIRYG